VGGGITICENKEVVVVVARVGAVRGVRHIHAFVQTLLHESIPAWVGANNQEPPRRGADVNDDKQQKRAQVGCKVVHRRLQKERRNDGLQPFEG